MKLSSGWEQSIYVILILSELPESKVMNSVSLSERLNVSQSYLKKIIKTLVNEGLIGSTPGKYGGFSLARSLETISFYDVFVAIEGRGKIFASQQLLKQFLGKEEGDKAQQCVVTESLNIIETTLIQTLSQITLDKVKADIVAQYRLEDLRQWIKHSI
ncbi:Rrf2 family transcriptional regulator [Staphylococcus simulans]|uniref:RrF2 family transcriptional regulator n=1 Tax=Staphylococcus simulans TaxID=1286 RepID=UPI001E44025D|nr:Rrf2 family transcriptional regulator [Staphylococcus simulans]MCD8914337.1 Rrf2 family transcriptional regulator [Staphylococcus simulans]